MNKNNINFNGNKQRTAQTHGGMKTNVTGKEKQMMYAKDIKFTGNQSRSGRSQGVERMDIDNADSLRSLDWEKDDNGEDVHYLDKIAKETDAENARKKAEYLKYQRKDKRRNQQAAGYAIEQPFL